MTATLETELEEAPTWTTNLVRNSRRWFPADKPFSLLGRSLLKLDGIYLEWNTVSVIVGAGPSLDRNIDVLAGVRRKWERSSDGPAAVIFATDAALAPLLEAGILPDFVVGFDEVPQVRRFLQECPTNSAPLICPITVNTEAIQAYLGANPHAPLYFYGNRNANKYEERQEMTGGRAGEEAYPQVPWIAGYSNSVAMMALAIARRLGIPAHFLVGCDFAAEEGGRTHCRGFRVAAADMGQEGPFYVERVRAAMAGHIRNIHGIPDRELLPVVNCTEGGALDWNNLTLLEAGRRFRFMR